ncbi:MAG: RagB/SusD family nutrient uptake outer membrane protein [Flavobacteriaceae bacterium]|nr:MAG: RagB/SusD family nutrient uptake outer membrane protein [Flavobacteriaceae bacterium]
MKKYSILIALVALFSFSACEDSIDLVPRSELTANGFWASEDGAKAAHIGIYANMRAKARTFWSFGELRSDLWGGMTLESPSSTSLIESDFTVTTAPYNAWGGFYTNIHRVNDFILNVPNIDFTNEAEKAQLLGQVYAIRAYYYYHLVKTWGDVPVILAPMPNFDPAGLSSPRVAASEVLAIIKKDIETSLTYFGSDNSLYKGKNIYWSKSATQMLKADVYLWTGKLYGGGAADYTTAKNSLDAIQGFSLEDDFDAMFSDDYNDEFIFAFEYKEDQATNIFSSFTGRGTEIHPLFDRKGNSMETFVANGGSRYGASEKLLLVMDDVLDTRGDATFIRLYANDNAGAGYPTYNADTYQTTLMNKFIGHVNGGGSRIMDNHVPIYRYADAVLMTAEAMNNLGEDPSALINSIRKRAYGDNYDAAIHAYVNGSQEENTNAILDERMKEFVGEGKRWYDLRRAGDQFVFDNVKYLTESYKFFFPIKIGMIGRNPLLEQTAGY